MLGRFALRRSSQAAAPSPRAAPRACEISPVGEGAGRRATSLDVESFRTKMRTWAR